MSLLQVILKPKEEQRIQLGHAWVYGNEVARLDGEIRSGDVVDVLTSKGEFVGRGFLNTASKILVRIMTRRIDQPVDRAFFGTLIRRANERKRELGYADSYRVVFGEADGMSGLIVDKYADVLVVQIVALGMDRHRDWIVDELVELFHPQGIYERSDVGVRIKEGLEEKLGVLYGDVPDVVLIREGGLSIEVNVKSGQKTGYFLDQQANHQAVGAYVKNKTVLDCFSHTGGFGIHAAAAGASHVTFVDLSASACEAIRRNCERNNLTNVSIVKDDVFGLLRRKAQERSTYDVVILDPPAFTKNADNLRNAYAGYKEINLQAMKIIADGGILVSCSCSHYMTPALFLEMLIEAAADAKKKVQMLEFRTQGKDHPTLLGSEETLYLKCVALRVSEFE
jgi:23S rRNA (cytosine1962-C5)-methyltransferase